MGWWPLDIETGGINLGALPTEGNNIPRLVNVFRNGTPQPESDLVWGDGPADIVDKWMNDGFQKLFDELNKEFIEDMGRGMTALEFLSGLAFSLPGLCHPDYSSNDLMGLPICETHSLQIRVVPIEDE